MYQYAKAKLMEELEKKKNIKTKKEKEENEVIEKLESIKKYDELRDGQPSTFILTIFCMTIGIPFVILPIVAASILGIRLFFCVLEIIGIVMSFGAIFEIKKFCVATKEIKLLRQKGVKGLIKQKKHLQKKKLELKKENDNIQNSIDKITTTLEHIDFFHTTVNDLFYQSDTKEEYEAKLDDKLKYDQLLDEYLNEGKIYANVCIESKPTQYIKLLNKK